MTCFVAQYMYMLDKKAHDFYQRHSAQLTEETGGTFYAMTPGDFERLLGEDSVQALLREWFDVSVAVQEARVHVTDQSGQTVDLSQLYIAIQSDPKKSYEVYQIGMSLWHS
jgi:hypothetical protein